jgi:hypothetical protein
MQHFIFNTLHSKVIVDKVENLPEFCILFLNNSNLELTGICFVLSYIYFEMKCCERFIVVYMYRSRGS